MLSGSSNLLSSDNWISIFLISFALCTLIDSISTVLGISLKKPVPPLSIAAPDANPCGEGIVMSCSVAKI